MCGNKLNAMPEPLCFPCGGSNMNPPIVDVETRSTNTIVNREGSKETHNYRIKAYICGTLLVQFIGLFGKGLPDLFSL